MDVVKATNQLLKALEAEDKFSVEHITTEPWKSPTFSGVRIGMTVDVYKEYDYEFLRDEVNDIEFAIPGILVADARCVSKMQLETPTEANLLVLDFLLLEDA